MRIRTTALAAMISTLLPLSALADEQPGSRYSLKADLPDTGSSIRRDVVTSSRIPFDKRYSELTSEQRELLKRQYERMGNDDEPPFPVDGLGPIYKALAAAQKKLLVEGSMVLFVEVDRGGQATSVSVLRSPDPEMTRVAAAVLMLEKYKPAVCDGAPCKMQFPFRMEFKTRF